MILENDEKQNVNFILFVAIMFSCSNSENVTVVQQYPPDPIFNYSQGNRAPLIPDPFIKTAHWIH